MEERTGLILLSLPFVRCSLWKTELFWSSFRYHWYASVYGRENWPDLSLVNIGTLQFVKERTGQIFLSLPLVRCGLLKREQACSTSRCHSHAAVYGRQKWPDLPLVTIGTLRSMEEGNGQIFLSLPFIHCGLWKRQLAWSSPRCHWYALVYERTIRMLFLSLPFTRCGLWMRELARSSSCCHRYAEICGRETGLIFLSLPLVCCCLWKRELTWSSSRYHWYAAAYGRENWHDLPLVTIATLRSMEERIGLIFLSLPFVHCGLWKTEPTWSSFH